MKNTNESQSSDRGARSTLHPIRILLAGAILLATTALSTADVTLQGTVGPRTIDDDVIIASNTTCVLNGTTIKGTVRVLYGARLITNGAWVDGSLLSYRSRLVDLRGATRVTWNVRGNNTRAVILRSGTRVGGLVQVNGGKAPEGVDSLLIRNSAIEGDVRAYKCDGRLRVINNTIKGRLVFGDNRMGRYVVRINEIWKDLIYLQNTGNGSILANTVGGNLVNEGNSPTPKVKRNRVRGDFPIK